MTDKDLLKEIYNIRMQKNYSQEYMANKLGISQSYYSKIERGIVVVSISMLTKILNILEADLVINSIAKPPEAEKIEELRREVEEIKEIVKEINNNIKDLFRITGEVRYIENITSTKSEYNYSLWEKLLKNWNIIKQKMLISANNNKVARYYLSMLED